MNSLETMAPKDTQKVLIYDLEAPAIFYYFVYQDRIYTIEEAPRPIFDIWIQGMAAMRGVQIGEGLQSLDRWQIVGQLIRLAVPCHEAPLVTRHIYNSLQEAELALLS